MWKLLAEARKEAPGNAYVRRAYGEKLLLEADNAVREGRLDDALKDFKSAGGYLGADPRLIGLEAELRVAQRNAEAAVELFAKLLAMDPDSAYLKRRIARLNHHRDTEAQRQDGRD
jgi:tetratricopeptide (TPR) repeat protein